MIVTVTAIVVATAWFSWFAGGLTFADAAGDSYLLTNSAVALTFTIFGCLVLEHRPGHRIGALFTAFGGCYTLAVAALGLTSGVIGWPGEVGTWIQGAVGVVWIPAVVVCLPLILQLFPNGRVLSPRWRPLVPMTIALGVLAPFPVLDSLAGERPELVPAWLGNLAGMLTLVLVGGALLVLVVSMAALVVRARRSRGDERAQVLWLLWAVAAFVVLNAQRIVTTDGPVLFLLALPLVPAAATVAVLRFRLYDITVVINRSIVYGVLTVGVVAGYLGIVAVLSGFAADGLLASPVVAAGVVALAFEPVRGRVQTAVDQAMYGSRRDPSVTAARIGDRLGDDLGGILEALCEALRVPWALIEVDHAAEGLAAEEAVTDAVRDTTGRAGEVLAARGDPAGRRAGVDLPAGPDGPVRLVVGLRAGEKALSRPDVQTLALVAPSIGLAVRAVRLRDDVARSRTQIVGAREEERRRLRRDLHDGLGSVLTAISLKVDAVHNLLPVNNDVAGELLLELRCDLTDAIADIRRLIYDLRPPDLDELGLIRALRQRAEQAWHRDHARCLVTLEAPAVLPSLPAAVEVAAYRIVMEAVTNALRHSRSSYCHVVLSCDDELYLAVRDNGSPGPEAWLPGVGLRSMEDRVAELGGSLWAGPTSEGGLVRVSLPLGRLARHPLLTQEA